MAVNFDNNWKNILDKLESTLESEFKGALPVYKGKVVPKGVNQSVQLTPVSDNLIEYFVGSEVREYTINVRFAFNEANVNETALDHILRQVSRLKKLIQNNIEMDLADGSNIINCRFESTELDSEEDSEAYVVDWEFKCLHHE